MTGATSRLRDQLSSKLIRMLEKTWRAHQASSKLYQLDYKTVRITTLIVYIVCRVIKQASCLKSRFLPAQRATRWSLRDINSFYTTQPGHIAHKTRAIPA